MEHQTIVLLYILFIWFVIIHTFEEVSQGVFDIQLGRLKLNKRKYLFGAGMITTLNLGTLALIVAGYTLGLYLSIFTSSVIGILQAVVHTIGYFKEGRKAQKLGAGFYTSIPRWPEGCCSIIFCRPYSAFHSEQTNAHD
jgi:hypothetical protein